MLGTPFLRSPSGLCAVAGALHADGVGAQGTGFAYGGWSHDEAASKPTLTAMFTFGGQPVMQGNIVVAELLGGESYLHVRVADETIVVKTYGEASPQRGDKVEIALPSAQCHLFDAAGHRLSAQRDAASAGPH